MNCANHPDIEKVAFCRTCGKPLCANCTRSVHGVIYCESCLAARLEGVQPNVAPPAAGFVPVSSGGCAGSRGPNPALAGVLAGFFPFGVGAVYTGQYAKGLAHLVIFTLLVLGASSGSEAMGVVCGLGIAGFYFYQIIDAVRKPAPCNWDSRPPIRLDWEPLSAPVRQVDASKVPVGRSGAHRPGRDLPAAYARHLGFQRSPDMAADSDRHWRFPAVSPAWA